MAITITQGTQSVIRTDLINGTETQVIRLDIGSGTSASNFGGTISRVTDLLKGTITSVGSITNIGTVKGIDAITSVPAVGARHADAFQTVVSTGTLTLGTIKGAVSGSSIYITDLIVSAGSATNVEIASGGTSTPIMGTLYFAANGGAVMNFKTPLFTASGSALVYKQSSAISPLSLTVAGYVD